MSREDYEFMIYKTCTNMKHVSRNRLENIIWEFVHSVQPFRNEVEINQWGFFSQHPTRHLPRKAHPKRYHHHCSGARKAKTKL